MPHSMLLQPMLARLSRARSLRELLDTACADVIALHGADMGNVQMPAPCGDLVIVAHTNTPSAFLCMFGRVASGSGTVCERAAALGQVVYVADVAADAAFAPFRAFAQSVPFTSVLSIPLLTSCGAAVGVISAHSKQRFAPSRLELDALRDFSVAVADRLAAWGTASGLAQFVRTVFHELQPSRCATCSVGDPDSPMGAGCCSPAA